MIKEGNFPKFREADLRLYKETFDFTPKGEIDFSKAKIEGVVTKPKREANVGIMPIREVDLSLNKASYPGKLRVINNMFKGTLE